MQFRSVSLLVVAMACLASQSRAQVPIPFSDVEPSERLTPALRQVIQTEAGKYPLVGFRFFSRDSVLVVFEDSGLTREALRAGTWAFGPPVTKAEADGCPPEKVLGRKIARALWRALGKPPEMSYIKIAVRGTDRIDRWTAMGMYYHHTQLEGPWIGDPNRPDGAR